MADLACTKAGCNSSAELLMTDGMSEFAFCERHAAEAEVEHDYSVVRLLRCFRCGEPDPCGCEPQVQGRSW